MQNTKQVLDWDNKDIFKRKREFYLDEDLVDKIDSIEYGAQVNKIEEIEVNWVPVEPDESKTVKLKIPRVINAVTSDSESDALSAAMGKYLYTLYMQTGVLYRYRWSVATFDDLPESWNQQWDVYNILDTGMNYAWTWTEWDALWWSIYTAWYNIEISEDNVISTLRQPDHYLWHWNCIKWQSPDFLETAPYNYNAWDYYIVNKTADLSWTKRIEMLWGEYHIPSLDEVQKLSWNNKAAEVIYNMQNSHAGKFDFYWVVNPSNLEDAEFWGVILASNWWYYAWESNGSYILDAMSNNMMTTFANEFLWQVLAFKDEPAIPDNTWTSLWDDVYYNASLWLYSVLVWEDEWITFKDKVEWATTPWWKWNLYQRWNCNPIDVNEYEINTQEIDYSQIQPSTYSSNKITLDNSLFVNSDDAWWSETQTAAAMRWPCPEWYIVPDWNMIWNIYMMSTYLINWWSPSAFSEDIENKIDGLKCLFLTNTLDSFSLIWSILPYKTESVSPEWEWWELINDDDMPVYYNESLWLITIEMDTDTYVTFKDKLLWATEVFNPIWDLLQKWSITLNKAKLWNQYNRWNNYAFDLFWNESIELVLDSDADVITELQSKSPYWYNWSIINFYIINWWRSTRLKAASSGGWSVSIWWSIFTANPNLWDLIWVENNLRPRWTSYIEDSDHDSEIEDEQVDINDIYLYDWTQWLLIWNHVVPHVFVTQKEYDAISDKKYSNWTLYLFVDKHPGDEGECDWMYEYDYFYNLWDNRSWWWKKVSSILPSDYSYCKDYIVAELNSKPMCYYNKFREENKLVAWTVPDSTIKSWDTKLGTSSNIDVRFLWTEEESWWEVQTKWVYLSYVETHDEACNCDECTYRFYTIDWSQRFEYNSYCGGGGSTK